MLGMFCLLMMYLVINGKRFTDAGLRDVLIQSKILAEGSVDRVLEGIMYIRIARCCKWVYKTMNRILFQNRTGIVVATVTKKSYLKQIKNVRVLQTI